MKKFIKYLLLSLLVVLLLAGLLITIALTSYDTEVFKDKISQVIQEETGQVLKFDGKLEFVFFPYLGVELNTISLKNPVGFTPENIAIIDRLLCKVDLLSVLTGNPKINRLSLQGLQVNLVKDEQGRTNWSELNPPPADPTSAIDPAPATDPSQPAPAKSDPTDTKSPQPSLSLDPPDSPDSSSPPAPSDSPDLDLQPIVDLIKRFKEISIEQAQLNWRDESNKTAYQIRDLSLNLSPTPTSIPITFAALVTDAQNLQAEISLQTEIRIDDHTLSLAPTQLELKASGAPLPVQSTQLRLTTQLTYVITEQQLSAKDIKLRATFEDPDFPLLTAETSIAETQVDLDKLSAAISALDVKASFAKDFPLLTAETSITETQVDLDKLSAVISAFDAKASFAKDFPLLTAETSIAETQVDLDKLSAAISALDVKASFAKDFNPLLTAEASIAKTQVDLDKLSGVVSALKAKVGFIKDFSPQPATLNITKTSFDLEQEKFDLTGLKAAFAGNDLAGTLGVTSWTQLNSKATLTSKVIDLDAILNLFSQPETADPQTNGNAQASGETPLPIPIDLLRQLNTELSWSIGTFRLLGLTAENTQLTADVRKAIAKLKLSKMNIYEGLWRGDFVVDVRKDSPKYRANTQVENLQFHQFLIDLLEVDSLSGIGNLQANLTSQGQTLTDLKKNLNGQLAVKLSQGTLLGIDLKDEINNLERRLKGEKSQNKDAQTVFSNLSISATAKQGVVSSQDLDLRLPYIRTYGRGSVDLGAETIDYRVEINLINSESITAPSPTSKVKLPVQLTGNYLKPKAKFLVEEALAHKAKQSIDKAIKKETKTLEKKLKKKLKDLFR